MGTINGSVVATIKIVDHGPDEDKWNLAITGDGFTLDELGDFADVVDNFVAYMQTVSPFSYSLHWDKVNIHRIDVESDDSGADHPGCDQNIEVDTYYDAEFCAGGVERRLSVDETIAMDTANIHVPEWDAVLVFVNSNEFGGSASGSVATASLAINEWGALHEVGHAGFGLADEYCTEDGGVYSGSEPSEPNVTATLTPLKWQLYVDVATPIPTTSNPDATGLTCDAQPSPVADGTVGAFEGAKYVGRGLYRPEYDCLMRTVLPVPLSRPASGPSSMSSSGRPTLTPHRAWWPPRCTATRATPMW